MPQIQEKHTEKYYVLNFSKSQGFRGIVAPNNSILQPVPVPIPGERKATFKAACLLTHEITLNPTTGRRHYRTKAGDLLPSLDSVIQAIITDNLLEPTT